MEKEIETVFPHIPKKGCTVKLYHYDELAGKVSIESDIDAIEALNNFIKIPADRRTWFFTQKIALSNYLHLVVPHQKLFLER